LVIQLMKAIRYSLHFPLLIVAALLYWWAIHYDVWIFGFDYFHFGLTGALHSIAIVAALRNPRLREPSAVFRVQALWFIALVTLLGAVTPIGGLWGSIVWSPITAFLGPSLNNLIFVLVTGSVIGSAGYWALVRRFWMPSLGRADLLRTVALCVAATILVGIYGELVLSGFGITESELGGRLFDLLLTTTWWLAFSTSLYWSETTEYASSVNGFRPGLMRKASIGLGVALPSLVIWYLAAVWWAPVDAVTMALPQGVRNTISEALLARGNFDAKDFPAAKRAARLNPDSEDAWTRHCATGVRAGNDMDETLDACARAASMTDMLFHSQVIAQAYEEAHRPCDGLPILKKTMGEEKASNVSPIFSVGRLEATCGEMENAETHLRAVVRLRKEDLRPFNWEDRPPGANDNPDSYETASRRYLSEARQNLSALLTLRHKDAEAFDVCRSALGIELKRCTCRFEPREGVTCDFSATK
jgi:hypothetical protein